MENVIDFSVEKRNFTIYASPAIELVDLILAIQDLSEVDENGMEIKVNRKDGMEIKVNRKNYREFAELLLSTTFIVEKKGNGTEEPVTKASFVGLEDVNALLEFIGKVIKILMGTMGPILKDVEEKKTESKPSLEEMKNPIQIQSVETAPLTSA